ncbi:MULTISPECIES: DUF2939 domain-containing protein [unclassified Meiothermus]|uniref:DUF2939 domain-containing protein n=1 Tax=unclassified Meiothermus TaxID=370471 RepID=UPI000D7CD180|nr:MULTISPECIES: DUF2939 domain-containing protein [unclassified Meiothermus]PZA07705.1 hypothetical protein DNA98_05150 [Meiothermus sp. Pnk-1]RYM34482.1 DUF2939 domain-containing protein [Meiothermus sp. PNK-Is4]
MSVETQEKATPTLKKPGFWFVVLAGLLLLAYAWFSPYLALIGIQRAIQSNNAAALERYIDFPRVRESLKADFNRLLVEQAQQDQTGFGALGLLFAAPLVDQMVDALITPEGLASIGTDQEPQKGDLEAVGDWRLRREGFSRALLHPKDNPDEGLLMERQGLGWKVVRLQIKTLPQAR